MKTNRTRQIGMATLLIALAGVFLLNVWQSFRYTQMERELTRIHRSHHATLEENKRLIVGIAGLRSPRRIRAIAEEDLGLEPARADRIQRIDFPGGIRGH